MNSYFFQYELISNMILASMVIHDRLGNVGQCSKGRAGGSRDGYAKAGERARCTLQGTVPYCPVHANRKEVFVSNLKDTTPAATTAPPCLFNSHCPNLCATSPPSHGNIPGRGDNEFEPQKVVTPVVAPVDVVSAGGRTLFVRVTVKDKRGERREQYDMNDDIARAKKKTKKTVDVSLHIEECASPLLDDVGQQPRGKSPEETDMLQELASMAFSTTHSVVKADSKVADEVLSMVKQMMNKLLLFVLLEDNEYLVSNFVRVIHALSVFVGIVLNCLSLMKSFLSFPIDDHFLTKDEIVSEGQLR